MATSSFQSLQQALATAPILALPDFSIPFEVETDASQQGLGAVLQQRGHPIAYISKALSTRQQAQSAYERELNAVLHAVKKWHQYLAPRPFILKTDHRSLKFLLEQRLTNPFQHTSLAKLAGYEFEICYKKGRDNIAADALSRSPSLQPTCHALSTVTTDLLQSIKDSVLADVKLRELIKDLEDNSTAHSHYQWRAGVLRRKGKMVVGRNTDLHRQLIELYHASAVGGHSGVRATTQRIASILY